MTVIQGNLPSIPGSGMVSFWDSGLAAPKQQAQEGTSTCNMRR